MILFVVVAVVATALGASLGWQWALAPMLGWGVWTLLSGALRSMVGDARAGQGSADPEPVARDQRSRYWCQECGTEMVMVVRGSDRPPRHCGLRMQERSDARNN